MTPAIVVFLYLAVVLYIGIFAFRKSKTSGEDYFLASRSLGPYIFEGKLEEDRRALNLNVARISRWDG